MKAKIEAKIREEQEAKRARRKKYQELASEAAEKRRELAEWQYHKMLMTNTLQNSGFDMVNYHFIGLPQMSAAAAAYKGAVGAYGSGVLGNIL